MGKKSLGYVVLAALILALAFGAHSGTALQPPPAGGPGPGTLPDILGITTGMPAQQALDLLRAHDPGHTAAYVRWTIPQLYGNRPIMSSMNTADTGTEVFDVRLTIPPLEQRVYRVERVLHVTAPRAALVNELLQKYGAATWDPRPNAPPPQAAGPNLFWLFDETGQRVDPPNMADKYKMRDCLGLTGQAWGTGEPAVNTSNGGQVVQGNARGAVVQANPALDPDVHHVCDNVVVVHAGLTGSEPTWILNVEITDATIQHRAAKAWNNALNAVVQKGAQQQRKDASKQALPKF
jgi:hypothetical protein